MDRVIEPTNGDHIKRSSQITIIWIRTPSIYQWHSCDWILCYRTTGFHKRSIEACSSCTRTKIVMKRDSTLKKTLKAPYGPDDLLGTAASTGPMSIVTHDEIGPSYIQDGNSAFKLHTFLHASNCSHAQCIQFHFQS